MNHEKYRQEHKNIVHNRNIEIVNVVDKILSDLNSDEKLYILYSVMCNREFDHGEHEQEQYIVNCIEKDLNEERKYFLQKGISKLCHLAESSSENFFIDGKLINEIYIIEHENLKQDTF